MKYSKSTIQDGFIANRVKSETKKSQILAKRRLQLQSLASTDTKAEHEIQSSWGHRIRVNMKKPEAGLSTPRRSQALVLASTLGLLSTTISMSFHETLLSLVLTVLIKPRSYC